MTATTATVLQLCGFCLGQSRWTENINIQTTVVSSRLWQPTLHTICMALPCFCGLLSI